MEIKDFEELQKDLTAKRKEKDKLTADVKYLSGEKISLLNEIVSIKENSEKEKDLAKETKTLVANLLKQKADLVSDIKRAREDVKKLEDKKDSINLETLEIKEKIDKDSKKVLGDLSKIKEENKRLSDKQVEVSSLKNKFEKIVKEVSDEKVELDNLTESFKQKCIASDVARKKLEDDSKDLSDKSKELDKEILKTKELEKTLQEKLVKAEALQKINEGKSVELEKAKIEISAKERIVDAKTEALNSEFLALDKAKKELRIKELRVNEIVRTNGIDKELKQLEERASK